MSQPVDPTLALPTDLGAPSISDGFPVGMMADHHVLLLADDVTLDEVEALAMSLDTQAGWVGAGRLQLSPGASLLGPWELPVGAAQEVGLPDWVSQAMVLDCPTERSGPLPAELVGVDPLMDSFPSSQPTGKELVALHRLRLIARRLAGGIRVADNGQIVVPDPERSTMLTVYSPVWLTPEAAEVLFQPFGPGVVSGLHVAAEAQPGQGPTPEETEAVLEIVGAEAMDAAWSIVKQDAERLADQDEDQELDGYSVVVPIDATRPDWGNVELRVRGVDGMPLAVWGESWATGEGVIRYVLTWHPLSEADAFAETLAPERATERRAAGELIEQAATVVLGAVGGVVVDDAGFLVSLME